MQVQTSIEQKLTDALAPQYLEVLNESHMHNVPPGSESHFKVVLVSEQFAGKRQVQRHQLIYKVLSDELAGSVHALALHTFAPDEWQVAGVPSSPDCMGGSKSS